MKNLDSWHFCGSSLDQEGGDLGQFYLGLAVKKVANCENTKSYDAMTNSNLRLLI